MKAAVLLAVCLCICAATVQSAVIGDCKPGRQWWWLSNQSVQVRDSSLLLTTHISVHFDQVFYTGSVFKIRRAEIKRSSLSIRLSSGYIELFSDKSRYSVVPNSYSFVKKYDGLFFTLGFKNLESKIKLGTNIIEDKGLRYVYTATKGGFC